MLASVRYMTLQALNTSQPCLYHNLEKWNLISTTATHKKHVDKCQIHHEIHKPDIYLHEFNYYSLPAVNQNKKKIEMIITLLSLSQHNHAFNLHYQKDQLLNIEYILHIPRNNAQKNFQPDKIYCNMNKNHHENPLKMKYWKQEEIGTILSPLLPRST